MTRTQIDSLTASALRYSSILAAHNPAKAASDAPELAHLTADEHRALCRKFTCAAVCAGREGLEGAALLRTVGNLHRDIATYYAVK